MEHSHEHTHTYTHSHDHDHIEGEEHIHEHEHEHTHQHVHEDGSVHTHTHSHEDGHEHSHTHTHAEAAAGISDAEKTKALLGYMIDHNEHHAEELADMLPSLGGEAQKKLSEAIGCFEAGNVQLREVLELI